MSLRAALIHVLKARPQVSPNPGFLQQLKELEIELSGTSTCDDIEEMPRREVDKLSLFLDGEIDHVEGSQRPGWRKLRRRLQVDCRHSLNSE